MASGMEIAGLVLAILPLLVEGAKAYKNGIHSLVQLSSNTVRDRALKWDYNKIWFQLFILNKRLQNVVLQLPDLCASCKSRLRSTDSFEEWEDNDAVQKSLLAYVGGEEDNMHAFLLIMSNILALIDQLVSDPGLQLSKTEQDASHMYDRVKSFMALREDGTIRGRFRDRFRFFDNTERRTQCLADLKEWNQHLNEMLASVSDVNTTRSEAFDVQVTSSSVILPFLDEGRRIFHALTSVAQHHWDCPCSSTHEAMLCLDVKPLSTNSHVRALDFLIKKSPTGPEPEPWLEGRFMIRKSTDNTTEVFDFTNLCDILEEDEMVHLLVEVSMSTQSHSLKQLRPGPHRFRWLNKEVPLTLHESLERQQLRSLKDKRTIALAFAYAMLQFHGNACFSEHLQKEAIYFYALTDNMVDFGRPFVKADFHRRLHQTSAPPSLKVQHRNPAILNLGILLIELDKGVLFASLREQTNKKWTLNQDLFAARKLVGTIDYPDYQQAVRACLETSWVCAGKKVDLSDSEVAKGFVKEVIDPLKKEMEWLCNMLI